VQRNAISSLGPARLGGQRLRRAAWITLFVLGLFFWIPTLLRARLGASAVTDNPTVDARAGSTSDVPARIDELSAVNPALTPTASCRSAALTSRLVVTTTILGKTRRAAIVNGRLYREGDKIAAGSELYRLAGVTEDRIELVALAPSAGVKRLVTLQPAPESAGDHCVSH
jgi:hypothetical protein